MEPEDFPFAVNLAKTMHWNMTAEDFEFNKALEPDGCLVMLENREPIGLATCISYGKVGWFGNLVVKEESRKRGAGTQLVQHAVDYLKSRGVATVGLYAYKHLVSFYGGIGFRSDDDFVVLKANFVTTETRKHARLKTLEKRDLPNVLELDEECFGASRRKLLESIIGNPENVGFVLAEGSKAVGFATAKVFGEAAEVGPLVWQERSPETAVRLLEAVLSRIRGAEAYMYAPATETQLLDAAFKAGFRDEFRLTRMFLGSSLAKNCIYSAESLERG